MNEQETLGMMRRVVYIATKGLTIPELSRLHLAVSLDQDARNLPFWEKVENLFDSDDPVTGKPKMHTITQAALDSVVMFRYDDEAGV